MIFTLKRGFLLKWAWGPRRVTTSKRYKTLNREEAYPSSVTANHGLWKVWFKLNTIKWIKFYLGLHEAAIVIPDTKAEARIKQAMTTIDSPDKENCNLISDDEISQILAKREILRAEKRYEEADKLRDMLISAGVEVSDNRI